MDLSKAFDCLPHSLIIVNLHAYGLSLDACKILPIYLSGRHQRTKIQNDRSKWKLISKGVPLGSILGPLLFNILMNDMLISCDQAALWMVFSVCLSVCLSVCPSVCLSVCPSVCPSVCLSVCLSVSPPVRHTFLTMFPSSYHHEISRSYH